MIEARDLTEEEAVTTLETIGDTPSHGVFIDGRLIAVCPGDISGARAKFIRGALEDVRDNFGGIPPVQ